MYDGYINAAEEERQRKELMQMSELDQMQALKKNMDEKLNKGASRRVTFMNNYVEERRHFNALKTTQAPIKKELDDKLSLDVFEHCVKAQEARARGIKRVNELSHHRQQELKELQMQKIEKVQMNKKMKTEEEKEMAEA